MADKLVYTLLACYLVIALAYAWERRWPQALYFLSAAQISLAVLLMGKQ